MKAIISASAIAALAFLSLSTTPVHSFQSGCPTNGPLSCPVPTGAANSCCVEVESGQLILTQAWDTNPSVGPANSFVISRLIASKCDGTYEENCDPSRAYTGISDLLDAQGPPGFLSKMQTFWPDVKNQDEQLWEGEWAASGTCLSTLDVLCLPSGSPKGADAVAYFNATMNLFESLPIYQWLSNAKLLPSTDVKYTLFDLTSALKSTYGYTPAIDCNAADMLTQVRWYFNLKGSFADGEFVPINAPQAGTCPSDGIQYLPKSTTAQ